MMRQDCLMHRWPFLLLVDESGGFTRFTPPFSQAKSSWFPRQSWWRWTGERWRPTKMLGCKWIESGTEIWAWRTFWKVSWFEAELPYLVIFSILIRGSLVWYWIYSFLSSLRAVPRNWMSNSSWAWRSWGSCWALRPRQVHLIGDLRSWYNFPLLNEPRS